jgi:hypothetical protein
MSLVRIPLYYKVVLLEIQILLAGSWSILLLIRVIVTNEAIYKGDTPSSLHLFTSVLIFLSNRFSTMSKCPSWQAIYKGDSPLSLHLFTSVLIFLSNSFSTMSKCPFEIDVVNICRNNGVSPLVIACEYHHTEIVEMLLENKADINKCTNIGESPLYITCQNGYLDIVLKLHIFTTSISPCRL